MEHTSHSIFCISAINTNVSPKLRSKKEEDRYTLQQENYLEDRINRNYVKFDPKLQGYALRDQNCTFPLQLECY